MGLDMYLEKCDRKAWGYKNVDIDNAKENSPKLYEEIKPFLTLRGDYYQWESIFEEVGYWRKANAIHNWFVENVQNGIDDCEYYEVSKEQAQELLDTCKKVKAATQLEDGWVKNGEQMVNGIWAPCYQEGKTVVDSAVAEKLLPTTSGFFFGSTDYDEWYMRDIETTIEILTKALEEMDFNKEMLVYCSSW